MLTVTSSAESFDLTTVETMRRELGILDQSDDPKLKALIEQASGIIAAHCNRVFAKETVVETIRLDRPQEDMILSRFPVVEIASIVEGSDTLEASDYEVSTRNGIVTRLTGDRPCWWPACKLVVTYSAGFALLGDLPFGVERACIQLVKAYYMGADRDPMVRSESVEALSSATYFGAGNMPPEVVGLLQSHRNYRAR